MKMRFLGKRFVSRVLLISLTWILGFWLVESGWNQDKPGEAFGTNAQAEEVLVILLADTKDGQPLPPREGPFRIIVPGEKRPARWVRQVSAVTVHKN